MDLLREDYEREVLERNDESAKNKRAQIKIFLLMMFINAMV